MKKVLVTGGAGYIGSHTVVCLIEQGYAPVIFDNFDNSSLEVVSRIESITGIKPECIEGDICNPAELEILFERHVFDAVIHFAGLKAVGESVDKPMRYYRNNVYGSLELFRTMDKFDCRRIVFSSSATVYGSPASVPISEEFPLSATNPYGQSKLMVENILRDLANANKEWQISILRYFNPVLLSVFGDDYDTEDGTGIRDYIHVMDLANAHLKALSALNAAHGCQAYNIGTGQGYSVLQMIAAFERASGKKISYKIEPRRAGDVAECFALTDLSRERLDWEAEHGLDRMMEDHWRWQSNNPDGYS